jgi:hypothetical protein
MNSTSTAFPARSRRGRSSYRTYALARSVSNAVLESGASENIPTSQSVRPFISSRVKPVSSSRNGLESTMRPDSKSRMRIPSLADSKSRRYRTSEARSASWARWPSVMSIALEMK